MAICGEGSAEAAGAAYGVSPGGRIQIAEGTEGAARSGRSRPCRPGGHAPACARARAQRAAAACPQARAAPGERRTPLRFRSCATPAQYGISFHCCWVLPLQVHNCTGTLVPLGLPARCRHFSTDAPPGVAGRLARLTSWYRSLPT